MLKRVHIKGYKSLVDVELCLEPLTVLIGVNASGKSNFLDALQLLAGLATSRTVKQAFDPPYRRRQALGVIQHRQGRHQGAARPGSVDVLHRSRLADLRRGRRSR